MASDDSENGYTIWGTDHAPYGPVEIPVLVSWIKDDRVTSNTWVYVHARGSWEKACAMPELQMFFKTCPAVPNTTSKASNAIKPGTLRRIKSLAMFNDEQLSKLVQMMQIQEVPQWTQLVKQGEHGDTMYLVLGGELRVRLMVDDKETILATLSIGEFFGEISLFDQGPRSADVVANADSLLLKVSASEIENLMKSSPDIAAPFLFSIAKTLTARIRADNKRFRDSVSFSRASGAR